RADRATSRALLGAEPRRARPGPGPGATPGLDEGPRPDEGVGREPAALLQRAQGAAADDAPRRPRRLGDRVAARPVGDPHEHRQGRRTLISVRGDAAEVALAETQAVLFLVQDEERRGRLADLIAAVEDGELGDDEAQALEEVIELGLTTGRIRSIYGPEGEQAALKTFRKLPGGRALSESAGEVTDALAALEGKTLEQVKVQSTGPGSFLVTLGVEGLELSVRLDRAGARIHSVGV